MKIIIGGHNMKYCACGCGGITNIDKRNLKYFKFIRYHHARLRLSDKEKEKLFWSKVKKSKNCWIWQAYCDAHGYGQMEFNKKLIGTHRYSWIISFGEIPKGLYVLHKCDNPSCVRPSHLFIGTQKDNGIDMMKKGRGGNSKLTIENVKEIRKLYKNGLKNFTEIARKYGVSDYAISSIIKKRQWNYV